MCFAGQGRRQSPQLIWQITLLKAGSLKPLGASQAADADRAAERAQAAQETRNIWWYLGRCAERKDMSLAG